jgi:glycosyltransferase involved in cell wall biosynthesis
LARRGHEVTLFATADSRCPVPLRSPVPVSYSVDSEKWDWQVYEAHQAREAFAAFRDFDVIHCHAYHFGMLFCDFVPVPSLHSVHIEPGPDYLFLARRTRNRHLHFASRHQARDFADLTGVHVVPHGVDMGQFRAPKPGERGDYLAFLGRFIPDKGPLEAIEIAKRAGLPLKLAAPRNAYYDHAIQSHVDGRNIQYVGELRGSEKSEFLSRARALVYPVRRGEPFGLVLVEAMASGLPVLALDEGAVPEIVAPGETGWIGKSVEDLVEAAGRLDGFDPARIRAIAESQWSGERMIDNMEKLLLQIVEEGRP